MTKGLAFTQAQVRRAVKAAESAGLRVRSVTVKPDGSIVVDSGESCPASIDRQKEPLASWDDA